MPPYKVLIVAPSVAQAIADRHVKLSLPPVAMGELEYAKDEVMQLVNLFEGARLLQGRQATIHGLLDVLQEGFDVIWLITHAEPAGWYLSDGIVNASETTTLVRSAGVFLTVMNTCSSYEVAHKVADELGTALICTVKEVPDRTAFITGTIFAQKLAAGMDYRQAYYEARPGQNSTYELIEARGNAMPPPYQQRPGEGSGLPDAATLKRFFELVNDLDIIVNGNLRFDKVGLRDIIKSLEAKIAQLERKIDGLNDHVEDQKRLAQAQLRRDSFRNWLIAGLSILVVALLITVFLLVVQPGT